MRLALAVDPGDAEYHFREWGSGGQPAELDRALTLNPRFAPAANNLAWLYREHGGDGEKALEVAQRTKEAVHDDLHISDTPGWIRYQQGVYQRAASLLKESAAKLPDNPVIHMYRRL